MEPNAQPGLVNKLFGRYVFRALLGMPEAARFFPLGKSEVTGIPVREQFFHVPPKPLEPELTVLITGGSQGSRTLNNAFRDSWPLFQQSDLPVHFVHQAGRASAETLAAGFSQTNLLGEVSAFIEDMAGAYQRADLVVSRGGAGALAELAAAGRPAILVPFPFATDDHQRKNAEAVAAAGAARVVLDHEMTGERLFTEIMSLASDRPALEAMASSAHSLAKPGAATRAADVLEEAAHLHRGRVDTGPESRKNITNNINTAKCF
jgi:UDP-N-acetylglucosamine--N-acetylmuramyl-(pentapeptide) pyrophosphoryl-undecaprenol N-acetylglucosamine transferase